MQFTPMKANDLSALVGWSPTGRHDFTRLNDRLTDQWAAEPKIDGWRFHLYIGATGSRCGTATQGLSKHFPQLSDLASEEFVGTLLDGELTWQGGMPGSLCNRANHRDAVKAQQRTEPAVFHAFDILTFKGTDVTGLAYGDRRNLLAEVVAALNVPAVTLVPQMPASGAAIKAALLTGYEGVMLKRRDSRYVRPRRPDDRTDLWLKVKRTATADLIIIGSTPGDNGCTGQVGSLKVGWFDGHNLHECGDVGSGLTDRDRARFTDPDRPGKLRREFIGRVVEVAAQEVTPDGRLRSPRFKRLRDVADKPAHKCDQHALDVLRKTPTGGTR